MCSTIAMQYCYKWKGFVFVKFETREKIPNFVLLKTMANPIVFVTLQRCKMVGL
jgi:hypothetical protein